MRPDLGPFFELGLIMHPKHKFLGASPDRITASGILIEIKCPLCRTIKHEVPSHYMPQLQLSLEVFDLECAHFVQYKPDGGEFDPPILDVVVVKRDRMWFEKNLPLFQKFITDLEEFKNHTKDFQPENEPIPRPVKQRKRKLPDELLINDQEC